MKTRLFAVTFGAVLTLLSGKVFAHGDHSVPGTLPPAPHGGFVKEADHEHEEKGGHEGNEKGHGHSHEEHGKEEKGHGHSHEDHGKEEKGHEHAHEDHGKEAKEAGHSHDENEKGGKHEEHEEEATLFFEAVYKDKLLTLYPLVLPPTQKVVFEALAPKALSNISVRIEFPRAKRFEDITMATGDVAYTARFDSRGANRFLVHVSVTHGGERKRAKVQVEED